MIHKRLDYVLGVLLFVCLIAFAPISSISADDIERNAQLGWCCYLADIEDGCQYDPLPGQTYNQQCCDDITNKCWGDIELWNIDYTWSWLLSCPRLAAPCAWTDPYLDDAIYKNPSGQDISRRAYRCDRIIEPTTYCITNPPLGCGPKTTWANYEYQECTQAECNDKRCD